MKHEIYKCFCEIDDAIMEWRTTHAEDPKFLVLPIQHRQAMRLNYAHAMNVDLWNVSDVIKYVGIPIIIKEEAIIL